MTDIPLVIAADFSIDWISPLALTQPIGTSFAGGNLDVSFVLDQTALDDSGGAIDFNGLEDLETAVVISLCTDRAAPSNHYGLQGFDRRGCWQDVFVGELGSWLWMGTDANLWAAGSSKLGQIEAWCNQALAWLLDAGLVSQTPSVDASWVSQGSVQIDIGLVPSDGISRVITYVFPVS